MKDVLRVLALLLLLGVCQVMLTDVWPIAGAVDLLMIGSGLVALRRSFAPAIVTGAAAGLIQDSLSGGLIGLHAFAKTAVNAVLGSLGQFLVVRGELASSLVVGLAAIAEGLTVRLLLTFLNWPGGEPGRWVFGRGLGTALACGLFLVGAPRVVMMVKHRRRRSRLRLR